MPKVDVPALLRTDKVNQAGFTGQGVNVAIIDSGYDHPDVPLVDWHDVIDGSDKPVDPVGHGTHCASDVKTCAPDAGLVAIRVMNEKGEGRPSDIIRGIQYAISHKDQDHIGVINLSLGGPEDGTPSSEDPLDRAVEAAWNAGIVVVSAAGNSGPQNKTVGAPGDDPKAISVGAALNPNEVSFFSSRGPTSDGKSKPDITAPGEYIVGWAVPNTEIDDMAKTMDKIRSLNDKQLVGLLKKNPDFSQALGLPDDIMTMPADQRDNLVWSHLEPMYKPSDDTVAAPGTSFASPEVAGVAADLLSAKPDASPSEIKTALTSTARNMGSQFGPNDQGKGFVDAFAALQKLQSA
jgi:subtilisin family serine protease